jgi:hypothetical protein
LADGLTDPVHSARALNRALLARQGLLARWNAGPLEAIERIGGLQAQDPRPPFVNLWSRIEGFAREDLTGLLERREAVRATLMRGTLHIVGAGDYLAWRGPLAAMLEAVAKAIQKGRGVSLDTEALHRATRPFFAGGARRFEEVREALQAAFPDTDERAMGYAVRLTLPLVSPPEPVEWAFRRDPAFVLAEDWLGRAPEAQTEPDRMILRYLAAFGPASVADAQTWSGLGGLKAAFERLSGQLGRFQDASGRVLFDLPDAPRPDEGTPAPARLLDGFDSIMLAHAKRSRIIEAAHKPLIASRNLRVPPVFLIDGFVAGIWTTSSTKRAVTLALKPFGVLTSAARAQLAEEAERLLAFLASPAVTNRQVRFDE